MDISSQVSQVPHEPGVYLFKDKANRVIYVGKAKDLSKRVRSYFRSKNHSVKTEVLVRNIDAVDFIVVDNEVEALLLENQLIKQHNPQYNIMLKDGKTYSYIALGPGKFPRIYSTRRKTKGVKLFGPYTGGTSRVHVRRLAARVFGLRTCHSLPKRECLRYHMGICSGPCIGKISSEDYAKQVKMAENFLKGDNKTVIKLLEDEMEEASVKKNYEIALAARDNIFAIKNLEERQKVDTIKDYDQDIVALLHDGRKAIVELFSVSRGVMSGKKRYYFEYKEGLLDEFVSTYYAGEYIPHEIIISEELLEAEMITKALSEMGKRKVKFIVPQKGEKKGLLELALKNAHVNFSGGVLKELQEKLELDVMPHVIECFDISNLGDQFIVGGMTQWVGGRPNKKAYRKFEIRSVSSQDDFAAMAEMIGRRYSGLLRKGKMLPDLIIIDGGPGQLGVAKKELEKLNLDIAIIGLAKQDEEIYFPGKLLPYNFNSNGKMMLLVRQIRDSVHKYVLAYNKKKRSMALRDEVSKL